MVIQKVYKVIHICFFNLSFLEMLLRVACKLLREMAIYKMQKTGRKRKKTTLCETELEEEINIKFINCYLGSFVVDLLLLCIV